MWPTTSQQQDLCVVPDAVKGPKTIGDSGGTESDFATLPPGVLNRLIQISFEPVLLWRWHAGIVEWNQGCEHLYGYSRSESIGRLSHELLQTHFPRPFEEIVRELEKDGFWRGELHHRTRSNQEVIVDSRWELTQVGEQKLVLETNRDITERKRYDSFLRDSAAQEKAALEALRINNRQKDAFLAMLAHELRNPLAPIRNASVLLAREFGADPKLGVLAAMIGRQSQQLNRLLDGLLDMSRITLGRIALQKEPLEIAEIIEPAIEMVQPLVTEKCHTLRVDRPAQALYVEGDRARLVQCLSNLLHNSAKYTNSGGEIVLMVREAPGSIALKVRDNGVGITSDLLPHVFDLFVQNEQSLDRSQGGLGIGLSIVKHLIDMHYGSISAASEGVGRGSTFSIQLARISPPAQHGGDISTQTVPKRRIVIVDDNSDSADSLAMLLRLEGHEVETAYSAQGAFEAVFRVKPEVVLLDIGVPQMDGYEIARRLRADPQSARLHLVALTGYGRPHDRERSVQVGFNAHLIKPIEIEAVNQALAALRPIE